jgi:metallo-beta-lactamase class B
MLASMTRVCGPRHNAYRARTIGVVCSLLALASMVACGLQATKHAGKLEQPHGPEAEAPGQDGAGAPDRNGASEPGATGEASLYGPVEFGELADGVWLHTSYKSLPGVGPFPSNGLIVRAGDGLLLVDTAWNDEQTEEIIEWARNTLGMPITYAVVTHAHDDKMGGVGALNRRGIRTLALHLTNEAARTRGLVPTNETLTLQKGKATRIGGVEVFYPGGGHTEDNLVVYVEDAKVLFGGCLIRPGASESLGNTADANVEHWDMAVESLQRRYGEARHVVPSHGPPGNAQLLAHTIALVRAHRAQKRP